MLSFNKQKVIESCLRLPLNFDAKKLQAEISSIPDESWGETRSNVHSHVQAVFAKGYPPVQRKPDVDRSILKRLPYLREIIYELIPGEPAKCVVAKLKPKGKVQMHRDGHVDNPQIDDTYFHDYFSNTVRLHIAVTTNDKAKFFCKDAFFHLPAGELYAVNNLSDHAALNDHHSIERTHIIVDMHPTTDLLDLIGRGEKAKGWQDKLALARLLEDSRSPAVSRYASVKAISP
jgi:hypothetical protein